MIGLASITERIHISMILFLLKRKRFLISILFLLTLFTLSIFHNGVIKQLMFQSDKHGKLISAPPYPPLTTFLLGSDRYGYSILDMVIVGAKYTIGITIIVTLLRMLLSILVASFTYSLRPEIYKFLKSIFEPFTIVPQSIIVYFILHSVLWMPLYGFAHPFWQRALFETLILVLIAIPNLSIHLSNEMRLVEKESFIEASKTLGARKTYIFFKHIIPHLYEKWILLFNQQFIQVLQLLAQLGFLALFFGGTMLDYSGGGDPPRTLSYEWSGLIGSNIGYLFVDQWIILAPIACFILTAISIALINDSIRAYFQMKNNIFYSRKN